MANSEPKWQRDYVLQVDGRMPMKPSDGKMIPDPDNQNHHVVTMPLTVMFDINRKMLATAQTGHFKIYNLKEETRRDLYHVWYEADQAYRQSVNFFAGYQSQGNNQKLLFSGYINVCRSYRSGPDWITEIEAFDGGMGNTVGMVSMTIPKSPDGKPIDGAKLIKLLTGTMPFTQFGACGNFSINPVRAISLVGSSLDMIERIRGVGGQVYVDNGNMYALKDNEYIVKPGMQGIEINSDQILGSPMREGSVITVTTILEPSVYVGAVCKLTSQDQDYNGDWQIRGVQHRGTISAGVCGEAITTLNLWAGTAPLVPVTAER